jgi:hypothetical protein
MHIKATVLFKLDLNSQNFCPWIPRARQRHVRTQILANFYSFPRISLITLITLMTLITLITQGISRREHPNLLHLVRAVTDAPSDSSFRVTVNVK